MICQVEISLLRRIDEGKQTRKLNPSLRTREEIMGNKRTKAASFVGGLVISSVIVGVLLAKNDKLRVEVEEQVTSLLKTTKNALSHLQQVVSGLSRTVSMNNNAKVYSKNNGGPIALKRTEYDTFWDFL